MKSICIIFLFLTSLSVYSQSPDNFNLDDDELNVGGDIFTDFNEDIEATQVMEDERFYRYGRFFSVQLGLGATTFDGNRGKAYEDDGPGYALSVVYFSDFQSGFSIGIEYSKHHFFLGDETEGTRGQNTGFGLISVSQLRAYFGYRYYIDTANLGTAITYSNPYFTGRLEYWYSNNKFEDQSGLENDNGGGVGVGLGGGLDFPIKLKESYVNVEALWHSVSFHDDFTNLYRPVDDGSGYDDLTGNVWTVFVNYVWNW